MNAGPENNVLGEKNDAVLWKNSAASSMAVLSLRSGIVVKTCVLDSQLLAAVCSVGEAVAEGYEGSEQNSMRICCASELKWNLGR